MMAINTVVGFLCLAMHTFVGVVIHTIVGWECDGNTYSCRFLCVAMQTCVGWGLVVIHTIGGLECDGKK